MFNANKIDVVDVVVAALVVLGLTLGTAAAVTHYNTCSATTPSVCGTEYDLP